MSVNGGEGGGQVGVNIKDGEQLVVGGEDGDDELGEGGGRTGNVVGEGVDVVEEDGLLATRTGAAHPALKGDAKAAVASLVGANGEQSGLDLAVESGPVKVVKSVVELADHGGHGADPIAFIVEHGTDALLEIGISLLTKGQWGISFDGWHGHF